MTVCIEHSDPPPGKAVPGMWLYVCVTCRETAVADGADAGGEPVRAGAQLYAALLAEPHEPGIAIVPIECLSVCTRSCAVSFAAPGKWTYVYGGLPADSAAPVLLEGARLYMQAGDGLIPWKQRPAALKKGVIARIPPLPEAM